MKLVEGKLTPQCTDGWWQVSYSLPCPHEIQSCVERSTPIMPSQIHRFWKQLSWERLPDVEDPEDYIPMDPTQLNLRQLATLINQNRLDDATAWRVNLTFTDGENPSASTVEAPEPSQTRREGRRRPKNPCQTNPLPSEIRQQEFERGQQPRPRGRRGRGRGRRPAPDAEFPTEEYDEPARDMGVPADRQFHAASHPGRAGCLRG